MASFGGAKRRDNVKSPLYSSKIPSILPQLAGLLLLHEHKVVFQNCGHASPYGH